MVHMIEQLKPSFTKFNPGAVVVSGEQSVDAIEPAPSRSDCEGGSSKLTVPVDYKHLPSEAELDDLGAAGKIDWAEEIR